jgi:murein DD-endopeptidase MepM/ murein hydrolase activator NlpD
VSRIAAPRNDARLSMQTAVIQSSLYGAADAAGLPDAITQQIAEIFAGDIDFYHDLRRGDRFSVVYEVLHVDGEPVKTGRVVAAEFVNAGRALRAFWFAERDGEGGYYSADGRSLRLAFLRSPLEFSRITSGFSLARMHPIFNTVTAHRGIDYGAPTGTPVRSTGEGKVAFAGQQGGYGNVVIVQHHGTYSTVYGHLSRFAQGLRTGSRVAQGEVIGYVGATGWATGPHLHYEFRVDNQARDPLRIALPQARPIPDDAQPRFLAGAAELSGRMELLRGLPVAIAR